MRSWAKKLLLWACQLKQAFTLQKLLICPQKLSADDCTWEVMQQENSRPKTSKEGCSHTTHLRSFSHGILEARYEIASSNYVSNDRIRPHNFVVPARLNIAVCAPPLSANFASTRSGVSKSSSKKSKYPAWGLFLMDSAQSMTSMLNQVKLWRSKIRKTGSEVQVRHSHLLSLWRKNNLAICKALASIFVGAESQHDRERRRNLPEWSS